MCVVRIKFGSGNEEITQYFESKGGRTEGGGEGVKQHHKQVPGGKPDSSNLHEGEGKAEVNSN